MIPINICKIKMENHSKKKKMDLKILIQAHNRSIYLIICLYLLFIFPNLLPYQVADCFPNLFVYLKVLLQTDHQS